MTDRVLHENSKLSTGYFWLRQMCGAWAKLDWICAILPPQEGLASLHSSCLLKVLHKTWSQKLFSYKKEGLVRRRVNQKCCKMIVIDINTRKDAFVCLKSDFIVDKEKLLFSILHSVDLYLHPSKACCRWL